MGFTKLNLKEEYRSFSDDIIRDFYIPALGQANVYKRAVGYFSSTALIDISKGISGLIRNNGTIKIIASPQLSDQDLEAIKEGYKSRDEVIEQRIVDALDFNTENFFEKKRLNLLASLISKGILDIKLAFIETDNDIGIYHEKMGFLKDTFGNKLVFTGSMNETRSALNHNYESFDVFCSWTNDAKRVSTKEEVFDKLWNNEIEKVKTIKIPEVAMEKIKGYIFEEPDLDIDEQEFVDEANNNEDELVGPIPKLPAEFEVRDYQQEAVDNWGDAGYQGIFDMATGTGKTYTALLAATKLFEENAKRLAIVIVCPYQHLVEQWVEDIEYFGMNPIIGYSASKQRNWKKKLQSEIEYFNYGISNVVCFVTTNATFTSKYVQESLKNIEEDLLIIVDEAHNFGAEYLRTKLLPNAKYRLGLSATINRHNDEEGTEALFAYFGEICIRYTLEMAISNDMLTPYYYYPVPVYFTEEEISEYQKLSKEIANAIRKDRFGKVVLTESAKFLLIKRARLIAGARNKIAALRKEIEKHLDESHMLVYCGATTISDPDYVEGDIIADEMRQIDVVTNLLGNELNLKISKFTSEENSIEREQIKKTFAEGENLQALVAIRCLDEGVNIPSIKTAFILASSTNPKEYIQRRGRVLRQFEGKEYAVIYDFITLPMALEDMSVLGEEEIQSFKSLAKREVDRMEDFANIALNSSVADGLISDIKYIFKITEGDGENYD